MEKAALAARCSSVCIQFIRKSRENSLVYLFHLFDKALWITVLCQSVSVFQNLWLFKSQTGFSTKQIFSQVTKMDENWLLQEQLLFSSFYRWSLEGPQSPAVWNTETKEEAMDLWSKAEVRHHTKQLQSVIINFFPISIPRPTTELVVNTNICESCQVCVWWYSPILYLLSSIFYKYHNNHSNDCLGWIWGRKFLDQHEKSISS